MVWRPPTDNEIQEVLGLLGEWEEKQEVEEHDPFNPSYYQAEGFDLCEVIMAFSLDFPLGAVLKYIVRAGRKPGASKLEDLKKAREFLRRAIEREEWLQEERLYTGAET